MPNPYRTSQAAAAPGRMTRDEYRRNHRTITAADRRTRWNPDGSERSPVPIRDAFYLRDDSRTAQAARSIGLPVDDSQGLYPARGGFWRTGANQRHEMPGARTRKNHGTRAGRGDSVSDRAIPDDPGYARPMVYDGPTDDRPVARGRKSGAARRAALRGKMNAS